MISKLLFFFFLGSPQCTIQTPVIFKNNKEFLKLGKMKQTHYLVLKKLRQGSLAFKASLHYKANPNSRGTGI